jgi:membrane dipeptidase
LSFFELSKSEEERARELHSKSIVIDAKNWGPAVWNERIFKRIKELSKGGAPSWLIIEQVRQGEGPLVLKELAEDEETRKRYVRDVRKSGVTAMSTTLAETNKGEASIENTVRDLVAVESKISIVSEVLMKAASAEDIRRAKNAGKLAIIYDFQNTDHLGYDLDNIDLFYNLGVRIIQLTYNMMNLVGVGCTEKYEKECGLSSFGVRFVERLNKLGILVDTGHCGTKTTLDAAEVSKDPIVATHTACRDLYSYPRAKTDEALKAIAESGGFVGIYTVACFYPAEDRTLNHFLNEIDHAVEVAGVDHVAIGQDYGGQGGPWPDEIKELMYEATKEAMFEMGFSPELGHDPRIPTEGIEVFSKWPNITRGLVSRGYSDQEIQKILGENFLRVFAEVVG